jgi:outer membrane protein TolC
MSSAARVGSPVLFPLFDELERRRTREDRERRDREAYDEKIRREVEAVEEAWGALKATISEEQSSDEGKSGGLDASVSNPD